MSANISGTDDDMDKLQTALTSTISPALNTKKL